MNPPAYIKYLSLTPHDIVESLQLEDTVCLELIRHEDDSIVSISKISEVIASNCSSLPARRRPQGLVVIGVCLSVCLCAHSDGQRAGLCPPRTQYFFDAVKLAVMQQQF